MLGVLDFISMISKIKVLIPAEFKYHNRIIHKDFLFKIMTELHFCLQSAQFIEYMR